MAEVSEIGRLAERRRQLVEESERYRRELAGAVEDLRSAAVWVDAGYALARSIGAYVPVITGVAGLFGRRRKRSFFGLLGKAWGLWRLGKKVVGLWAQASGGGNPKS